MDKYINNGFTGSFTKTKLRTDLTQSEAESFTDGVRIEILSVAAQNMAEAEEYDEADIIDTLQDI